jgi:hypothetical protein
MLFTKEGGISKRVQFLLRLSHQGVESGLHVGQLVTNVVHEDLPRPNQGAFRQRHTH